MGLMDEEGGGPGKDPGQVYLINWLWLPDQDDE